MSTLDDAMVRKIAELLKVEIEQYREKTKGHSGAGKTVIFDDALLNIQGIVDDKKNDPGYPLLCEIKAQMAVLNIIGGLPLAEKLCGIMGKFDDDENGDVKASNNEHGQNSLERHRFVSLFEYAATGSFDGWMP